MFKCKPERNAKQALLLVFCLSFVSAAGFFLAAAVDNYKIAAQLVAVFFLALSVLLVVRYTVTEMEYAVSGQNFIVLKNIGGKQTVLCSLDLADAVLFADKNAYINENGSRNIRVKYNYCQNLIADSYLYMYQIKDKKTIIEFEPNPAFVEIMKNAINEAKKD